MAREQNARSVRRRITGGIVVAFLWSEVRRCGAWGVEPIAAPFGIEHNGGARRLDEIPEHTLTTSCAQECAVVPGAMACVTDTAGNWSYCGAIDDAGGSTTTAGVTCTPLTAKAGYDDSAMLLCLSPERFRWRFQLTNNPELLALGREGIAIQSSKEFDDITGGSSGDGAWITLNASAVEEIDTLLVANDTSQLVLRAADPTEVLDVRISRSAIVNWQFLQVLSIRNIDISAVTRLPVFPRLVSLDLSKTQLRWWPIIEDMPVLSVLDLSNNKLADIPARSLPIHLNALNISSNALVGLPVDISDMDALYKLSLARNDLSTLEAFPKLVALKMLDLSSCNLSIVPTGLANLPILESLDLSMNPLDRVPDQSFPATLITLNLRDTNLPKLPSAFNLDKNWESIDLSQNTLSDEAFSTVQIRAVNLNLDLVGLTTIPSQAKTWAIGNELSLSGNELKIVDASDLPAGISALRLSTCLLSDVPTNLNVLSNLRVLELSNNLIKAVPSGTLPPGLTELSLAGCGLSASPDDLVGMKGTLEILDLRYNNIEEIDLNGFSKLHSVYLQNNSLSALPADIFNMPLLTRLDLRGNPIRNMTLTTAQIQFLSTQLVSFAIDDSAFTTTNECETQEVLRGKYAVCTSVKPYSTPLPNSSPDAQSDDSDDASRTQESATKTSNSVLNLVIGISVGAVFLVSLFVASKRYRQRKPEPEQYDELSSMRQYVPIDMWEDAELLHWRVDVLDVDLIMQIGTGPYRLIWLARYRNDTVVLKRLYQKKHDKQVFALFIKEVRTLSRLRHPNIIEFLGVSWTSHSDVSMLLEFATQGDLKKYLAASRPVASARPWSSQKLGIALGVAEALVYLHSQNPVVLHRDLRSSRVFLDEDYTAKLSSLGLSPPRKDYLSVPTAMGTSRWIAPEVLTSRSDFDTATDIYSFGVILSELDSHELPFSDITLSNGEPLHELAILELLSAGALQPTISQQCPSDVAALIMDCVCFDPNRRPTAREVAERILDVIKESTHNLVKRTDDEKPRHSGVDLGHALRDSETENEFERSYLI